MNSIEFVHTEVMVRTFDRIYLRHVEMLNAIAKEEHLNRAEVLRQILDRQFKIYLHRRGMFNCQNCGKLTKNKYRHDIPVGNEVFSFGDCCFFNDSYKEFVKRFI